VLGDRLDADGGGEVGLAGSGAADQDDVLGLLGECAAGELLDLPSINLRLGELESGEVAV